MLHVIMQVWATCSLCSSHDFIIQMQDVGEPANARERWLV